MRLLYVVTYDISDPKRLQRVFKVMRAYGDHLQLSVFRCALSDREKVELMHRLSDIIKHDEDQVLFFPLGPVGGFREDEVEALGRPYEPGDYGAVVV